jgi:thiamine biosynthesis protein ThiI
MVRAAAELASRWDVPGLVTGESIAQVSSQTMVNLAVIDRATEALILRPLACWDKEDIIRTAREIGTEDFARTMPEYCGVISNRPHTAAKLEAVEAEEANMDPTVVSAAVERAEITPIDKVMDTVRTLHNVELVSTPTREQVIIDVRPREEQETAPLRLTGNEVLSIPFFELSRRFPELDDQRTYLLYCDRGVMSQLQAVELLDKGHTNVKVYRP